MTKIIFVCQVSDTALKVIKFQREGNSGAVLLGLETEELVPDINEAELSGKINQALKKLGYRDNHLVLSLSRNHTTFRYLKVPTQAPKEIEKIAALQAATCLPYPANELITGFQLVSTDKEGYAYISLVIVHKDIIERYIRIFREIKVTNFSIVLSSYGVSNLYSYANPQEPGPVILIDMDSHQAELAITLDNKLLFSRCFKLNRMQSNWEEVFVDEVNKTKDAYLKEVSGQAPQKIVILGISGLPEKSQERLSKQVILPIEFLPYDKKIGISEDALQGILKSDNLFANLIGLGLTEVPESLSLLPQGAREEKRKIFQRKESLRLITFVFGIAIILSLATAKNLDNKRQYLKRLKSELDRLAKEAKPLEEIVSRFKMAESQGMKKPSSLDILYELHRVIPANISLAGLNYEEGSQIIIHGQAPGLDSVLVFVSQLEKSEVFKEFSIKVRYATKKKIQASEIVDFEIVCAKAR